MDCRETLNLIPDHLDGTLTGDEQAAMAEHLAVCLQCAHQMDMQKRLAAALREMGQEEIQAPPELCGLVMSKLRTERRTMLPRLPAAWRSAVAAAAAAVLIIAGGVAGLKMDGNGKVIVYSPPETSVIDDQENTVPSSNDASGNDGIQPGDSNNTQPPGEENIPDAGGSANPSESEQASGNNGPTDKGEGKAPTAADNKSLMEEPHVMLSNGINVTSTFLKLAVDDLAGARAKAVTMAYGHGAVTQVLPEEQSGGKKIVVLRLTVASEQATSLISGLTGAGSLIDRQDERRDITSIYNETLIQYNDLQSRINSASESEEKRQLEMQAASYKQQLTAWDAEAGKRVIMLWLESR
ncbi:zf-HC2 domain-containing protein [Pelotomaculum terephthalicicum JT]|uniref:zf-HC2 domain-containing protein n=1 Tax=Pelotomaculum terephthalicicum TaxID=206393 RepID=UPI001F0453F0|nr:zf-HC2 domain-containing protein [Pelotomaculum terephthalicicum]MCG9967936.1 zf-HC2 domain-containing protein [Pelotomaculum terephthalicicum JT]